MIFMKWLCVFTARRGRQMFCTAAWNDDKMIRLNYATIKLQYVIDIEIFGWPSKRNIKVSEKIWREKVIRQEKGKEHNVQSSWPRTTFKRLRLLRDRESESVYSSEFGHMSNVIQPIRTSDSGSTWSLLGQNRCEETERAQEVDERRKRGKRIPPFFHQNDLAL